MSEILAAIDIGTSKVATVVAAVDENREIEILGRGLDLCAGIKKGVIVDVESVWSSIKTSITQAESMANLKIKSAYINVPASQVEIVENSAKVDVSDPDIGIRPGDIERAIEEIKKLNLPHDKKIVDVVVREYAVDDISEIKDPIGMKGRTITVVSDVLIGRATCISNLARTLEMADLAVDGIVLEPYANSEVLLSKEEKEFGVLVIDVGGGATEVSFFKDSDLICTSTVYLGGDNITKDLSIGLKIPLYEAEKMKREYELSITELYNEDESISVYDMAGDKKIVPIREIAEIIEARYSEILKYAYEAYRNTGIKKSLITGVVISGAGISYIDGVIETATKIFDLPVRVPSYKGLELIKPEYQTSIGILRYTANNLMRSGIRSKDNDEGKSGNKKGFFKKFIGFFNTI